MVDEPEPRIEVKHQRERITLNPATNGLDGGTGVVIPDRRERAAVEVIAGPSRSRPLISSCRRTDQARRAPGTRGLGRTRQGQRGQACGRDRRQRLERADRGSARCFV
jgi:hypothetical protein